MKQSMKRLEPHDPGFKTIKQLVNRMTESDLGASPISVDDSQVPAWQRQLVWKEEAMGLLALSILRSFPIGVVILWKKPNKVRVPIDGRQRLSAIKHFVEGLVAIPDLPSVPPEFRNKKYRLLPGDDERGFAQLDLQLRERFDDYEIHISQYDEIEEKVAMEIFVMLQGGVSLTRTEIRAALGGKVADFVSRITSNESKDRHPFFKALTAALKDRRKSHRNVCDVLLHEYLYPGKDKHWTSLEQLYREKSDQLTKGEETEFVKILKGFMKQMETRVGGKSVLLPQLRSAFLILTVFRAWRELCREFDIPKSFDWAAEIALFEEQRAANPKDPPWLVFTNELSNAGYAQNRIDSRHEILCAWLLERNKDWRRKDRDTRTFTAEQKLAIWNRAGGRCEHQSEDGKRCNEKFPNPAKADADHIVMWKDNGATSVSNGRLLCPAHNRGRRG